MSSIGKPGIDNGGATGIGDPDRHPSDRRDVFTRCARTMASR
jgi:hypothetical protein